MRINQKTLFVVSSLVLVRSYPALTNEGETQESESDVTSVGMAEISAGGMLAMIVLGIFGVCLVILICCASKSLIITCLKLHASNNEEPQSHVIQGSKYMFTSHLLQHPLASKGSASITQSQSQV